MPSSTLVRYATPGSNHKMPANDDFDRLLSIKVNVAKRISKDIKSYQNEADSLKQKIDAISVETEDEEQALLRKQYLRSFDETVRMLPECGQRLQAAKADIKKFLADLNAPVNESLMAEAQALLSA